MPRACRRARPDAIVVAEATRRQVGGLFNSPSRPLGLRGFAASQPAWRVLGDSAVANRFKALRGAATPLVGRDGEIELLLRHWASAKSGEGRAVLISAEAGVGKSRLAEAVRERIRGDPHVTLRYFCSPHHRESALYPVIGQLEHAAGFERSDDGAARRRKLANLLAGGPAEADLPLLAELLSVPGIEAESALELTPERPGRRSSTRCCAWSKTSRTTAYWRCSRTFTGWIPARVSSDRIMPRLAVCRCC